MYSFKKYFEHVSILTSDQKQRKHLIFVAVAKITKRHIHSTICSIQTVFNTLHIQSPNRTSVITAVISTRVN